MAKGSSSEAEPLLTNEQDNLPESQLPSHSKPSYGTNGTIPQAKQSESTSDEATSADDRRDDDPLFEGLPEVKARLKYILPSVGVGLFLSAADQTIVMAASGKIGSELESLSNTSWIATSYYLTLTSVQPLYGKLSDIFGRKSCLLFAYAVFGLGCLLCGLARNMNELIAARAIAGIGGGGMTTVVAILLSDVVPLRERGIWQGFANILFATGTTSGAPMGGVFADYLSWRWAFLIQVPLCVLAFVSVSLTLNMPQKDYSDWRTKIRRIDFGGAFILVAAVFCLMFGMDRGANDTWISLQALLPVCLSLPLFAFFLYIEIKLTTEPLAPAHIIFQRSLFASYLSNFFCFAGWMAVLFYLPLYYQAMDRSSASEAGLRLIPGMIASVIGSLSGGFIMQKTGKYFWLTVVAYLVTVISFTPILICSGTVVNSVIGLSIGLFFVGLGAGVAVTTTLTAVIANASSQDQATATACSYLFRSLGSVVGLALSATVVQQSLKTLLQESLKNGKDAKSIEKKVRQSLEYINNLEPKIQEIVRQCYGTAARNGFILMMFLSCAALICSLFIKEKKLSK